MSHLAFSTFIPGVKIAKPDEAQAVTTTEKSDAAQVLRGAHVSGRGWKKVESKKRLMNKICRKKNTWAQKEEIRQERDEIAGFNKEVKKIREEKSEKKRAQRKEALERKKMNLDKGQSYQLITNTKNLKRWSKKARASLTKMPKPMFEEWLHGKKPKNLE